MSIDEAIEDLKECDSYQVAKWLEELKAIKEGVVFYSNRPIEDIVLEARADAIEECISKIDKLTTYYAGDKEGNAITPKMVIKEDVIKELEQLKEQK